MPYLIVNEKDGTIMDCFDDEIAGSVFVEDISCFNSASGGFSEYLCIDGKLIKREKRTPPQPDKVVNGFDTSAQMGFFGNVWYRKLHFASKLDFHDGHKHKHDHVSLLTSGSVLVEIEGEKTTKFIAPTAIIISANKEHLITALEDNTTWWCVFALRDVDGELTDFYDGDSSPYEHVNESN